MTWTVLLLSRSSDLSFFLSIFTGSLIYEHYTRECEFGNLDKIKNTKHKKTKQHKKTQKLLAEFLKFEVSACILHARHKYEQFLDCEITGTSLREITK